MRRHTPPSALTGCERTVSTDAAAVSDAGGLRLFADELPALSGMALYPFRRRLRFSPAVAAALVAVLTLLQMGLGLCAAFFTPGRGSFLSAVSTGLYAVFYFLAGAGLPGKTAVYPADDL